MINPNLTELANLTETYEPVNLTVTGLINGTQPITMQISGNVSAVVSQPAYGFMVGLEVAELCCLLIIALVLVIQLYMNISRR